MANLSFDASHVKQYHQPDAIQDQPRDTSRKWSKYQQAIFDFVERGNGNAIVEAVAGSGKSTTIVEANKRVKGSSIFLAFNKSIADELKSKGINARTFHSMCYGPVLDFMGLNKVDSDKVRRVLRENLGQTAFDNYSNFISKLIGLARQIGVGVLVPDEPKVWWDLVEHHDLQPDQEAAIFVPHGQRTTGQRDNYIAEGCQLASEMLHICNNIPMIDFDDMLYLAVKHNLSLPKYDFVFVDEAQDTNAIQRQILRKIMKPTSRLIAVGDPSQAIYGFRGADSESMTTIAQEFNCVTLPLSISYRCASSVVNYARQWVSHIEAAEGANEGIVGDVAKWDVNMFQSGDLVVCRKTAPLMSLAYRMIRNHKPVTVLGREIGAGIKSLINKMKARGIDNMLEKLALWKDRECKAAGDNAQKVEAICDKYETVLLLCDGLPENSRTVPTLLSVIDSLFTDKAGATILCTIHKSKGLEAMRVWWLNRSECPATWVRKDWQYKQEINICYVAATRAKNELYFIEMGQE